MKWFRKLRMVYKILLPVSITLIIVLSILTWQIQTKGSEVVRAVAERELAALAKYYGGEVRNYIDFGLNESIDIAETIAKLQKAEQALERAQVLTMISSVLSDTINSSGVAYIPNGDGRDAEHINAPGSDAKGQFYPYVTSSSMRPMNRIYFSDPYFTMPQKTNKPYITTPYSYTTDDGQDILLVTLAAPIVVNSKFKGITFLDLSLNAMAERITQIKLYETGTVSVVTQEGAIITHPNSDLILENVFELDHWRGNQEIRSAFKAGKAYASIIFDGEKENMYYFSPFIFPQTGQTMYTVLIIPLDELLAEVKQLTRVTLIASVAALLVLLIVIFIGVRSSTKPLTAIAESAKQITKGDYNYSVDSSKLGGEILELNNSLTAMIKSLVENINKAETMSKNAQEQTVKAEIAMREADNARIAAEGAKREGMLAAAEQLENVVSVISTASQELSVQIEQSEQGLHEQADRVAETATAMEEMNSTVLEVASNASAAAQMSMQTRTQAESGAKIVENAVAGVQNVQSMSLALKDDMTLLAKQAESIITIMDVISDIADQTNLLALNAAIEAARAGDAGRGFAVVADEVRKLAEKTTISTTDVESTIKSIQTSVSTSIVQVNKTVELITLVTEQAGQSGVALAGIVALVDDTAGQVQAIATASEEQSATSEEINRAIIEMNSIALHSAQNMREATSAVNSLAAQAQSLNSLICEMKKA